MKGLLSKCPDLDAERIWQETEAHRSGKHEKLDLDELDAVSGGREHGWKREGCAATCEEDSWCGSNDYCMMSPTIIFGRVAPMAMITSIRGPASAFAAAMKCLVEISAPIESPYHKHQSLPNSKILAVLRK